MVTPTSEKEQSSSNAPTPTPSEPPPEYSETVPAEITSIPRTTSGFRKGAARRRRTSIGSRNSIIDDEDDDSISSLQGRDAMHGISDDVRMGLE